MLSGDAAMDAVVPFVCHKLLNTCISDVHQNMVNVQSMEKLMHDRGIDIVKSLDLSIKHGCIPLVIEFWEYIQKKVEKLHKDNNRPSPPVARIPNTYGPSSGSAYYFTEHGEQIREMPEYRVSGRITTANYDKPPVVDGVCNKKFQEHILQVLDIYSYGFVQYMGMHMDFISYKVEKGARTPLAHCTSTWKHHQKMFSMTLLANYQNIASIGNQNYSRTQGSNVGFVSNQVGFVDWRE